MIFYQSWTSRMIPRSSVTHATGSVTQDKTKEEQFLCSQLTQASAYENEGCAITACLVSHSQ